MGSSEEVSGEEKGWRSENGRYAERICSGRWKIIDSESCQYTYSTHYTSGTLLLEKRKEEIKDPIHLKDPDDLGMESKLDYMWKKVELCSLKALNAVCRLETSRGVFGLFMHTGASLDQQSAARCELLGFCT